MEYFFVNPIDAGFPNIPSFRRTFPLNVSALAMFLGPSELETDAKDGFEDSNTNINMNSKQQINFMAKIYHIISLLST